MNELRFIDELVSIYLQNICVLKLAESQRLSVSLPFSRSSIDVELSNNNDDCIIYFITNATACVPNTICWWLFFVQVKQRLCEKRVHAYWRWPNPCVIKCSEQAKLKHVQNQIDEHRSAHKPQIEIMLENRAKCFELLCVMFTALFQVYRTKIAKHLYCGSERGPITRDTSRFAIVYLDTYSTCCVCRGSCEANTVWFFTTCSLDAFVCVFMNNTQRSKPADFIDAVLNHKLTHNMCMC